VRREKEDNPFGGGKKGATFTSKEGTRQPSFRGKIFSGKRSSWQKLRGVSRKPSVYFFQEKLNFTSMNKTTEGGGKEKTNNGRNKKREGGGPCIEKKVGEKFTSYCRRIVKEVARATHIFGGEVGYLAGRANLLKGEEGKHQGKTNSPTGV